MVQEPWALCSPTNHHHQHPPTAKPRQIHTILSKTRHLRTSLCCNGCTQQRRTQYSGVIVPAHTPAVDCTTAEHQLFLPAARNRQNTRLGSCTFVRPNARKPSSNFCHNQDHLLQPACSRGVEQLRLRGRFWFARLWRIMQSHRTGTGQGALVLDNAISPCYNWARSFSFRITQSHRVVTGQGASVFVSLNLISPRLGKELQFSDHAISLHLDWARSFSFHIMQSPSALTGWGASLFRSCNVTTPWLGKELHFLESSEQHPAGTGQAEDVQFDTHVLGGSIGFCLGNKYYLGVSFPCRLESINIKPKNITKSSFQNGVTWGFNNKGRAVLWTSECFL